MKLLIVLSIIGAGVLGCPGNSLCGGLCDANSCEFCWDSYFDKTTCKSVTKPVNDCYAYEKEGVCKYCKLNYELNASGGCVATTIKNCLSAEKGSCTLCLESAPDTNGNCTEKCNKPNCDACGSNGCLRCKSGYYQRNNECVKTTSDIDKCFVVDDKGSCTLCDYDYNLQGGKCIKIPSKKSCSLPFAISTGILGLIAVSLF